MKILYAIPFIFSLNSFAQTSEVNSNVNWNDLSTTPQVESEFVEKNLIPADQLTKSNFVESELTNFDFLNQAPDERVFYSFKANVSVLNKYTDKITEYKVLPQETVESGKFKLAVKSCALVDINNVENQLAFLEIYRKDELAFKGWMSNVNENLNFPEFREIFLNLTSCKKVDPEVLEKEKAEKLKKEQEEAKKRIDEMVDTSKEERPKDETVEKTVKSNDSKKDIADNKSKKDTKEKSTEAQPVNK